MDINWPKPGGIKISQNKFVNCLGNGEAVCENRGLIMTRCLSIGCCQWDEGRCWSAVGRGPCTREAREQDNRDRDNGIEKNLLSKYSIYRKLLL